MEKSGLGMTRRNGGFLYAFFEKWLLHAAFPIRKKKERGCTLAAMKQSQQPREGRIRRHRICSVAPGVTAAPGEQHTCSDD